ncbi:hypothetical protein E0H73_10195 [Kribbella pittospori]|uniref:DUF1579 domain-containing protein n=1 Tax=Kribbella pittospori TaxID=722689 RepID=A0A4R0KY79_9ACTN|nr:hypothetical protein [Kribbella pittospori]TCC64724.1 hypothetical protein E0H73_10195 [Kribbella pittospori]
MTENAIDKLRSLEPLLGTWRVEGPESSGTVQYAWAEFGGWLVQQVDLGAGDTANRGVEYIGYDKETDSIRSHFFGGSGEILEYTYVLDGKELTIYFGGPESPAKFVGAFNDDFTRNTGAWAWPGGGYESTMTKQTD